MMVRHQSPDTNSLGKEVDYQGSRQIDSFTRRYYEKELGAGLGPSPSMKEHFGYTEPFRRFVQHETFSPQANEIPTPKLPGCQETITMSTSTKVIHSSRSTKGMPVCREPATRLSIPSSQTSILKTTRTSTRCPFWEV